MKIKNQTPSVSVEFLASIYGLTFIFIWCLIKSPPNDDVNLRVGLRSTVCTDIRGFFPVECSPFHSSILYLLLSSGAFALPQSVGILVIKPDVLVHACFLCRIICFLPYNATRWVKRCFVWSPFCGCNAALINITDACDCTDNLLRFASILGSFGLHSMLESWNKTKFESEPVKHNWPVTVHPSVSSIPTREAELVTKQLFSRHPTELKMSERWSERLTARKKKSFLTSQAVEMWTICTYDSWKVCFCPILCKTNNKSIVYVWKVKVFIIVPPNINFKLRLGVLYVSPICFEHRNKECLRKLIHGSWFIK